MSYKTPAVFSGLTDVDEDSEFVAEELLRHAILTSLIALAVDEQSHADGGVAVLSNHYNPEAHVSHLSYSAPVHVAQDP